MKFNRSHVFAFVSLVVFVVLYLITDASTVSAAETNIKYIPLSPNLPLDIGTSITGLPDFLNKLFTATIVAGAILAVIMVAIGGFEYMTTDSVFSIGNAKDRIQGAIGGLFVILASILFLTTINPNIVNLNLFKPDSSSSSNTTSSSGTVTATKTVTNSDGSTTITYSDGTTAVKFSDGTKKVYDTTAGTVTYYDSSGNKTKTVNADGSVDTYSSNNTGSQTGTQGKTTSGQTAGTGGGGTTIKIENDCTKHGTCPTDGNNTSIDISQIPEVYDSGYYNNDTDAERYEN